MLADDEQIRGLRLPNTLQLPPSHTAATVGYFLKRLYSGALKEAHPRHLMALIEKIHEAERAGMGAGERWRPTRSPKRQYIRADPGAHRQLSLIGS